MRLKVIFNFLHRSASLQCWRHEKRLRFRRRHCGIPQGIFQRPHQRGEIWDSWSFECRRWIHFSRLHKFPTARKRQTKHKAVRLCNEHSIKSNLIKSCFRLAKQRFSDTTHNAHLKLHDEKHRSESLPSSEHSLRPYHYTGAISKLKAIEPKDASSQDSGINLSFHEDERKKLRNSSER